jgi:histidinol dehydrogenase
MEIIINPSRNEWNLITQRTLLDTSHLDSICKDVFNGVSKLKDHAIRQYTHQFDKVEIDNLDVSADEIAASVKAISNDLKAAINLAKDNIWKFHKSQEIVSQKITTTEGVECWQESRSIEKVGIYSGRNGSTIFNSINACNSCQDSRLQRDCTLQST